MNCCDIKCYSTSLKPYYIGCTCKLILKMIKFEFNYLACKIYKSNSLFLINKSKFFTIALLTVAHNTNMNSIVNSQYRLNGILN